MKLRKRDNGDQRDNGVEPLNTTFDKKNRSDQGKMNLCSHSTVNGNIDVQSRNCLYAKKYKHQIVSIVNEIRKMDEALKEAKDAYYNDDFVPYDKSYQNQYNRGTDHNVSDNPSDNDGDTNVHNQDREAGTDDDNSVNDDLGKRNQNTFQSWTLAAVSGS